ncbi:Hypothetical predicted protein, partial [Lynx pardinus]
YAKGSAVLLRPPHKGQWGHPSGDSLLLPSPVATHSILQATIWTHHVHFLEEKVLPHGATFTIWNVGKQGSKVVAYCDTAAKKMEKAFYR